MVMSAVTPKADIDWRLLALNPDVQTRKCDDIFFGGGHSDKEKKKSHFKPCTKQELVGMGLEIIKGAKDF